MFACILEKAATSTFSLFTSFRRAIYSTKYKHIWHVRYFWAQCVPLIMASADSDPLEMSLFYPAPLDPGPRLWAIVKTFQIYLFFAQYVKEEYLEQKNTFMQILF